MPSRRRFGRSWLNALWRALTTSFRNVSQFDLIFIPALNNDFESAQTSNSVRHHPWILSISFLVALPVVVSGVIQGFQDQADELQRAVLDPLYDLERGIILNNVQVDTVLKDLL